jgi:hypothetical protein
MNQPAPFILIVYMHAARCRKPHNFDLPLVLGVRERETGFLITLLNFVVRLLRQHAEEMHPITHYVEFGDRTNSVCKLSAFWESFLYVYRF